MDFSIKTGSDKKVVPSTYKPILINIHDKVVTEAPGEVNNVPEKWPAEIGEKFPFEPKLTEACIKQDGLVAAIIDKYVDYIWGSGFTLKTEDESPQAQNAIAILEEFYETIKINTIGRAWVKEALYKPGGYIQLKVVDNIIVGMIVLDGKTVYITRDKYGNVTGYNQYKGSFDRRGLSNENKLIPLDMPNILPLHFNVLGDGAYGYGIVAQNLIAINQRIGFERDMATLIHRKANAPLHIILGDRASQQMPTVESINQAKADLQVLTKETEFASDANTELKVVDFGKIAEKFEVPLNNNWYNLIAGFQVPEVLLGKGNIAEGLADAQGDAFDQVIETKREPITNTLEDLNDRILSSHKLVVDIDVSWNLPQRKVDARLQQLSFLLPTLQPTLQYEIEKKIAIMLDIDPDIVEDPETLQARKVSDAQGLMQATTPPQKDTGSDSRDKQSQPVVPGSNKRPPNRKQAPPPPRETFKSSDVKATVESTIPPAADSKSPSEDTPPHYRENATVLDWLGFDYQAYITYILKAIEKDSFTNLHADDAVEKAAGYLSEEQITNLKQVLSDGMSSGSTMIEIKKNLEETVGIPDLYEVDNGVVTDTLIISSAPRAMAIARTETLRMSRLGAVDYYKDSGADEYSWVAASDACDICQDLNGQVFSVDETPEEPHPNCRCSILAVTPLNPSGNDNQDNGDEEQ